VDTGATCNLADRAATEGIRKVRINPVTIKAGIEKSGHTCTEAISTRLQISNDFLIPKFTALIHKLHSEEYDIILGNQVLSSVTIIGNGKFREPTLLLNNVSTSNEIIKCEGKEEFKPGENRWIKLKISKDSANSLDENRLLINNTKLTVIRKPNPKTKLMQVLNATDKQVTLTKNASVITTLPAPEINNLVRMESIDENDKKILSQELEEWKERREMLSEQPISGLEEKLKAIEPKKQDALRSLISKFSKIFARSKSCSGFNPNFCATITLKGKKEVVAARNYSSLDRNIETEMVGKMLAEKHIEKTISEWSSPMLIVSTPKKDRVVINYSHKQQGKKSINQQIDIPTFPIPLIRHLFEEISVKIRELSKNGEVSLTNMDLSNAYYNLKILPKHRGITTFNTEKESFRYTSLAQGLSSAPSIYQKLMVETMERMPKSKNYHIVLYLDDILMLANRDHELEGIEKLFEIFKNENMVVNLSKTTLFGTELNFLGHTITCDGISIPKEKVESLVKMKFPDTKVNGQRYAGAFAYFSRQVRGIQRQLGSLYKMIAKPRFELTNEIKQDLEELRRLVSKSQRLSHIKYPENEDEAILIASDASLTGKGGLFGSCKVTQNNEVSDIAIHSYFSQSFDGPEVYLASRARELVALSDCLQHFQEFLKENMRLVLLTDHQSLSSVVNSPKLPKASSTRIRKAFGRLLQYPNATIVYAKGTDKTIGVCDALSRLGTNDTLETVRVEKQEFHPSKFRNAKKAEVNSADIIPGSDQPRGEIYSHGGEDSHGRENDMLRMIRKLQQDDEKCKETLRTPEKSGSKHEFKIEQGIVFTYHKNTWKIYIPPNGLPVLWSIHQFYGHCSSRRLSAALDENRLFVKNKGAQMQKIFKGCLVCTMNKSSRRTVKVKATFVPSLELFDKIYIDLMFVSVGGQEIVFMTFLDQFSRHLTIKRCSNKRSRTTAKNLSLYAMTYNLTGRSRIVTDNGMEFCGEFEKMTSHLGISHGRIAPYNKTGNLVERQHKEIRQYLSTAKINLTEINFTMEMAAAMINNSPHEALGGATPNMVVSNLAPPRLIPLLESERNEPRSMEEVRADNLTNYQNMVLWYKGKLESRQEDSEAKLEVGQFVAVRNPKLLGHSPESYGPYVVSKKRQNNSFEIRDSQTGKPYVRNAKDLVPMELTEELKAELLEGFNKPYDIKISGSEQAKYNPFYQFIPIPFTDSHNKDNDTTVPTGAEDNKKRKYNLRSRTKRSDSSGDE